MTGVPVAVVGCGRVGAKRADAIRSLPDVEVVATFDVDAGAAGALAASFPRAEAASTAAAACGRAAGGLAIVATTHEALAPTAALALEAGCHVLVEKPGARRASELVAVAELARARGLVLRVGFNHRFHPAVRQARHLLHQDRYGDVRVIRARYGHGGRPGYEKEWRADRRASGGGELLDQGVHLLDLVRFFAGGARLLYASLPTVAWDMEVEDNAFLHLGLPADGHAWLHASWTEWKNLFSFEIACRTAKLELTGLGGSYGPERLTLHEMGPDMGPPFTTSWEWPGVDASWRHETVDVLRAVGGEPGLGADAEDALATLAVVDEAYAR